MPRRSIQRPAQGARTYIDLAAGVGSSAGGSALPAICERIRFFREEKGLEQKALAKEIGISANAVSNWENGRGRPDINLLPDIAKVLDVTLYQLFDLPDPVDFASKEEKSLIGGYRSLTRGHKTAVEGLVSALLDAQARESLPRLKKVIFYDRPLAAGIGDPTEFEAQGQPLYLYENEENARADCVFTVNGDSMEPAFSSGDMVLISRIPDAPELIPGDVGAFISGNESYIKIYREEGLESLNPSYPFMRFDEAESVYLIGRVTGKVKPEDIASEEDISRYVNENPGEA